MVRLLNDKSMEIIGALVNGFFMFQSHFVHFVEVNNPHKYPCLYAMWHSNQFCVYGIDERKDLYVLVSRSKDGEIVANGLDKLGIKTIRGSKGKKGAVEATMQMVSTLKNGGNIAMMVDGPKGPPRIVKDGIVKLAKMAGVPIVPVHWYSTNLTWIQLPSWDKMHTPFLRTNMINLYGEPIYVSEEEGGVEEACAKLQASLEDLEQKAPQVFKEEFVCGLWRRKKK